MPRLFIALPIAEDVRASLARVAKDGPPDWRWVKPESMHLTLAFLGEVKHERVPAVEHALYEAAQGTPAFDLEAAGLGAFPDSHRARVVWAGVEGDLEQLASLQARLARALRQEGFSPDDRPFRPHITLARLRAPQPIPPTLDRARRFGRWQADEVRLYESRSSREGVRYEVVGAIGLDP